MLNLDASVTTGGQVDMLHAYDKALTDISKGALRTEVVQAVYGVMSRRFNRIVQSELSSPDSNLKHMVEWNTKGINPKDRLWYTEIIGQTVKWHFKQSSRNVPIDPRLENVRSTNHVFREKARVFERGEPVRIKPVQMKFLRWYDDRPYQYGSSLISHKNDKTSNVFAYESEIYEPGGGKYVNQFDNRFAIFWATADAQTSGELSRVLQGSKYFRGAVETSVHRATTIQSLKKMRATQRSIFGNGRNSGQVRAQAKEMIVEIQKELRRYGYNG